MDEMAPKLPKYVFRRANGSYRYKRNVPKHLQVLLGKSTLYRQLGNSYQEAMQNLPWVHARIESLFTSEDEKSARKRSIELIRGALGDQIADMVMAGQVPPYSDVEYLLNDLGQELHKRKFPKEIVQQVYSGKLQDDIITLNGALEEYLTFKSGEDKTSHDLAQRVERIRKDMGKVYGLPKLRQLPLEEITRQDANDLRDHLLERMSPNSAARILGVVRAAINHVIVERSLSIPNVFTKLKIKGAGATRNDRLPLSDTQVKELAPQYQDNAVAWALFVTLKDTGARVSEISSLSVADCDLDNQVLHIRPTPWRRLKTLTSQRSVPLSPDAAKALGVIIEGKANGDPVFPRYAKERGRDAASAMLMKRLRRVITDEKLTMHSLRHRMKDKLRNSGCPENLSMAILGHSANTVAANYGSGYAIEVMRDAMQKTWE